MSTVSLLSPQDFFRTQVCEASKSLQLTLPTDLEFYLVNLLCEFIQPERLKLDQDMGTPLALLLKKAGESAPDDQIKVLKRLGDTSLYVSGYFQDCFKRKSVDVSYYVTMGAHAYDQTAQLLRSHKHDMHFSAIYSQLAQEFRKLVAVITEISETLFAQRTQDLLDIYTKWQATHSEKLRKALEEQGVLPVLLSSKLAQ